MTLDELKKIGDSAAVCIAAGHDCLWQGNLLDPARWEDLRIEMQRRFRRSTGEVMAVLTVELAPGPKAEESGK